MSGHGINEGLFMNVVDMGWQERDLRSVIIDTVLKIVIWKISKLIHDAGVIQH